MELTTFAQALLWVAAFGAILAVMAYLGDRASDQSVRQASRPDQHIDPRELALTGPDYRDCVAAYFGRRLDHAELVAHAIDRTCFPVNEKGAASVQVTGPVTKGATSNGRSN